MRFGDYLKEKRESRGLSQRALSLKSGISNSTISRLEKGENTPDITTLLSLSKPLGVEVIELIEVSGIQKDTESIYELPEELKSLGIEYVQVTKELKDKGLSPEQIRKIVKAYEDLKGL